MREALKLTLEALKQIDAAMPFPVAKLAIKKAEEALAQPEQKRPQNCGTGYCSCIECVMEQEPVAWLHRQGNFTEACMNPLHDDEIDRGWMQEPLYTTPPQRKPLTDEQIDEIYYKSDLEIERQYNQLYAFARAIEAAHGIKE